jgi:hypothetical protein
MTSGCTEARDAGSPSRVLAAMKRRTLLAGIVAGLPCAAVAASRLTPELLAAEGGFQRVAFGALLNAADVPALAFEVEIPAIYRRWSAPSDTRGALMWSTLADFGRARRGEPQGGRHGALVADRSNFVTWSADSAQFRDETGLNEANIGARLADRKATAVRVQRADRGEVPILLVEADVSELERLRTYYIGLPRGTRTLYYLPQRPWSQADELVWARLRAGVLGTAS